VRETLQPPLAIAHRVCMQQSGFPFSLVLFCHHKVTKYPSINNSPTLGQLSRLLSNTLGQDCSAQTSTFPVPFAHTDSAPVLIGGSRGPVRLLSNTLGQDCRANSTFRFAHTLCCSTGSGHCPGPTHQIEHSNNWFSPIRSWERRSPRATRRKRVDCCNALRTSS
jgi:hypothetical protein